MNKSYNICLKCGHVEVRTDIELLKDRKYTLIRKKVFCKSCSKDTRFVAIKDIDNLRHNLENSKDYTGLDSYILKLIKR